MTPVAPTPPEVTVTFLPDGEQVRVPCGRRLLGIILSAGRPVGHSCRGLGVCLACGVWVTGPMSLIEAAEAALHARWDGPLVDGRARWRVACLARVLGDVEVRASYW